MGAIGGVRGVLEAGRECRCSGASRDIWTLGAPGGVWGIAAVRGVGVHWGLAGSVGLEGPAKV